VELLRITIEEEPGRIVCRLTGDLDAVSAAHLRAVLSEQVDEGSDAVIDVAGLGFIDSSGLGVLVGALKRFDVAGHQLHLRSPTPALRRVLDMTGLASAFVIEH
jgi:stage II sporulation protein AA (anti-sigma F factor antagonist)